MNRIAKYMLQAMKQVIENISRLWYRQYFKYDLTGTKKNFDKWDYMKLKTVA